MSNELFEFPESAKERQEALEIKIAEFARDWFELADDDDVRESSAEQLSDRIWDALLYEELKRNALTGRPL